MFYILEMDGYPEHAGFCYPSKIWLQPVCLMPDWIIFSFVFASVIVRFLN